MSDWIGKQLGAYQILAEIGHGGMANVYRAVQPSVKREVAIKVLPAHFMQDRTFLDRFQREVEVIARLQHPRILPVYDYGEEGGTPYIVMALMQGGSLMDLIRQVGSLTLEDTSRYISQIAEGLDFAHKRGIIHRDFKPSNVLLDEDGNPYLADFGIAKVVEASAQLTGSGMIGTPVYMAPELGTRGGTSKLIDVYALGVTVYQMLTGHLPFEADTPLGVMLAHASHPIPDIRFLRPDLPDAVQWVIEGALTKDPTQRTQSAGDVAKGLAAAPYGGAPQPASSPRAAVMPPAAIDALTVDAQIPPPPPAARTMQQPTRRFPLSLFALIPIALLIVVGLIYLITTLGSRDDNSNTDATSEPTSAVADQPTPQATPDATDAPIPASDGVIDPAIDCLGTQPGDTVTVAMIIPAAQHDKPAEILQPLIDACGIAITPEFFDNAADFSLRANEGTPPDIIVIPDANIREFAERAVPLNDLGVSQNHYAAFWAEQNRYNNQSMALPLMVHIKSMIWFNPTQFAIGGFAVPQTHDELLTLVDDIANSGYVAWSMGMESGDVTGWSGSDFIQDILLATQGPGFILSLISGDIPYNDPAVADAWILLKRWASLPSYSVGGMTGTLETNFYDAIFKPFNDPPEGMMVHQGEWVYDELVNNFPDSGYGSEYGFFIMPGARSLQSTTTYAVALKNTPGVQAIMVYLSSQPGGEAWAASGFGITPNNGGAGFYPDSFSADLALAVAQADGIVPDLGDTIGGEFTTTEWAAIVTYINGGDLDTLLNELTNLQAEATGH